MAILVDTDVLLRSVQSAHPHRSLALEAMAHCREAGHRLVLVPQNIYEFWVVVTRPADQNGLGLNPEQAWQKIEEIVELFGLLRDERAIFDHWQILVCNHSVGGKSAHDARLVAAMERHRIQQILTFNFRDFSRYDEVDALNPEDVAAGHIEL